MIRRERIMKKFIVEDGFWSIFPQAKIGVITCFGIDNSIRNAEKFETLLSQAEKEAQNHLTKEEFSSNTVIQMWREAYRKFKIKKGVRSSIEALLKRVHSGNHIGSINPLVDIYNAISLKYGFPCGGEDMDTFVGDVKLTKADGNEEFIVLGSDENSPPYEGELVYKDDYGAICRCLNWRESCRTMLTESTKNAFLCIELIDENKQEEFLQALKELSDLVEKNLSGENRMQVLSITNKSIVIDFNK